jgi:hypothetical protein
MDHGACRDAMPLMAPAFGFANITPIPISSAFPPPCAVQAIR